MQTVTLQSCRATSSGYWTSDDVRRADARLVSRLSLKRKFIDDSI